MIYDGNEGDRRAKLISSLQFRLQCQSNPREPHSTAFTARKSFYETFTAPNVIPSLSILPEKLLQTQKYALFSLATLENSIKFNPNTLIIKFQPRTTSLRLLKTIQSSLETFFLRILISRRTFPRDSNEILLHNCYCYKIHFHDH